MEVDHQLYGVVAMETFMLKKDAKEEREDKAAIFAVICMILTYFSVGNVVFRNLVENAVGFHQETKAPKSPSNMVALYQTGRLELWLIRSVA